MCYVSLLRSVGTLPSNAVVTCTAAKRQHFSSSDGYQAAHYLPGQIMIDQQFPWTFIDDRRTRNSFECLFADVEHLPANFNKADSAAEDKGLKESLRVVCELVIGDAHPIPDGKINRSLLKNAYQRSWRLQAERAFQLAVEQKEKRPRIPSLRKDAYGNILNLDERAGTEAKWNIEEQIRILQRYIESLHTWPVSLQERRMNQIESSFRP